MAGGGVVRIPVGETFDGIGPQSQPIPVPTQVVPVGQQAAVSSKGAHTLLLGDDTPGSTKKVSYDQSTARDVKVTAPTPKDEVPPPQTENAETPHHKKAGVVYGIEAPKVGQAPTAQLEAVDDEADDPQNSLLMAAPSETFIAKQDALIEIRATEKRKERLFWTGIIVGAVLLAGIIYFVSTKLMESDDGGMEYKKGATTEAPMDSPMQVASTMEPAMPPPPPTPPPPTHPARPPAPHGPHAARHEHDSAGHDHSPGRHESDGARADHEHNPCHEDAPLHHEKARDGERHDLCPHDLDPHHGAHHAQHLGPL